VIGPEALRVSAYLAEKALAEPDPVKRARLRVLAAVIVTALRRSYEEAGS
jgi:hypothetical protein